MTPGKNGGQSICDALQFSVLVMEILGNRVAY